tara:strand:+ start:31532 stop:33838 length:2307 start_codon:yes stop_codon:yes gene_type:complete
MIKTLILITGLVVSANVFAADDNNCEPQKYKFGGQALTKPALDKRTGKCFHQTPPGLQGNDLADFNHLSEGADVYPYEWFMSLKSLSFKDDDNKVSKPFSAEMDKRFGFMEAHSRDSVKKVNGQDKKIRYLMPYVGLTAAWSTQRTDDSLINKTNNVGDSADAYAAFENADGKFVREDQIVKDIVGVDGVKYKSIRMIGTNCALCHSGNVSYDTNRHFTPEFRIQGAPAMVNIRGFFKDLIGSTIVMFVKGKNLENFLADIKRRNPSLTHIKPKEDAEEIKSHFCQNLAKQSQSLGTAGRLMLDATKACRPSEIITLLKAKKGKTERMFGSQEAIKSTYLLLLQKTYGFQPGDNIGHLDQRMKFLAFLSGGTNPAIMETASAFNRTDAFGRISNLVLRTEFPVDLTAPVSLPWIWGLKYMGNLHYNGNSNSVLLRNVGQALGLGAMITTDKLDTTINVTNLDRLENLGHKIKVPEWNDVFKEVLNKDDEQKYLKEFEIDMNQARLQNGYAIYKQNCQSCHESNKLVGPSGVLREYNMFPLTSKDGKYSPDTDVRAALNAVVPVKVRTQKGDVVEIPFEKKIFDDVAGIKARYYQQYNIAPEQQERMEFRDIRGFEFFRDTYLGSTQNKKDNNYGKIDKGHGYKAKHLSGIWATAPFLHNGSVPNLMLLLTRDTERPKYFNVKSNKFDPVNIGFQDWKRPGDRPCGEDEEMLCFNTLQLDKNGQPMGNSNMGHNWGTELSREEKLDLINFLKYLPPEPEYAWEKQSDNY